MSQKSWVSGILFKPISDSLFKKFPGFYNNIDNNLNTNCKIQNVQLQPKSEEDHIHESATMMARLLVDHL